MPWPRRSPSPTSYVSYPSPGGNSGTMRGYLVQPNGPGPFPAVLVIHENRGLNPYIEDVPRRAATEGFLALGVTGFCWGGSTTNFLAVTLGADLQAGVPFYGAAAETARVPAIKAPLLIQYAESDERINALWPAYEAALKASIPAPSTAFTTTRRRATTRRRPGWPGSGRSPSSRSTSPEVVANDD